VKTDDGVLDVLGALSLIPSEKAIPTTIHEVLDGGDIALAALGEYVDHVLQSDDVIRTYMLQESSLKLGPCVTHPNKIICVGLNYRKHAEETNAPIPEYPILFNKFNNTLAGAGEPIPLPKVSQKVDYEAELVIVMGKMAKYVSKEDALSHVFGYCNVNDLSARDLQLRTHQWLLGKSCDKIFSFGAVFGHGG
jgi:2-keto-4-pentenoate hydratase/2-oxohepta-3-ene-1,7-dioic acid hydratase in catechol pathway